MLHYNAITMHSSGCFCVIRTHFEQFNDLLLFSNNVSLISIARCLLHFTSKNFFSRTLLVVLINLEPVLNNNNKSKYKIINTTIFAEFAQNNDKSYFIISFDKYPTVFITLGFRHHPEQQSRHYNCKQRIYYLRVVQNLQVLSFSEAQVFVCTCVVVIQSHKDLGIWTGIAWLGQRNGNRARINRRRWHSWIEASREFFLSWADLYWIFVWMFCGAAETIPHVFSITESVPEHKFSTLIL